MLVINPKKALEGDVVELLEDLPKYNLKRGQRGVVVTVFEEPSEAYDLEMEDEEGNFLGFAYSVKPEQIANIAQDAFKRGVDSLQKGDLVIARREFLTVLELQPSYIGVLLNLVLKVYADEKDEKVMTDWNEAILLLRFIEQLDPDYSFVRETLAITYLNLGVQLAKRGDLPGSLHFFSKGLVIKSTPEIVSQIQRNLAASYTMWGTQSHRSGDLERARAFMRLACSFYPSDITRRNVGIVNIIIAQHSFSNRDYEAAISAFEEAEDAGIVSHQWLNDYAIALVFNGQIVLAIVALERALAIAPGDEIIRSNLKKVINKASAEELISEAVTENAEAMFVPIELIVQEYHSASASR